MANCGNEGTNKSQNDDAYFHWNLNNHDVHHDHNVKTTTRTTTSTNSGQTRKPELGKARKLK